jgi:hypothetical protein
MGFRCALLKGDHLMAKSKIPTTGFFLQLSTACFFLILGLCGILPNFEESIFSLTAYYSIAEVIFGILELVCALVLFAGLFTHVQRKWMSLASLVIFIFWAITIVYTQFFVKLALGNSGISFYPDIMQWILNLMLELVVLASTWTINRHYTD